MPRRLPATIVALALMTLTGCGIVDDDAPQPQTKKPARNKAVADCAGHECRVRVTCKSGRVHVRVGAAPVRIRTTERLLRTTIVADFAGSRDDVAIRC